MTRAWIFCALVGTGSGTVLGSPPVQPISAPLYSFDLSSPSVTQGHVKADDVLVLNDPFPMTAINGAALGLGAVGDELDGLSSSNFAIGPTTPFLLLFSVSRETQGTAQPDPALVAAGVPYNVSDQAARGQQAGDEFISTLLFTLNTSHTTGGNNTMVRNNYDEGGSDMAARPTTSASSVTTQPQDNVDALADLTALNGVYFSASAASPSLAALSVPVAPSGANIFYFDLQTTSLFASFDDLGLQQGDDVDAMIVFDYNTDGIFNGVDRVLFSLAPGSPSLGSIPGGSTQAPAADVYQVQPNQAPQIFASAASLGLGAPLDHVDALDLFPCADPMACALLHGIRLVPGDFNGDGQVDNTDLGAFDGCFRGEKQSYNLGCEPGDFDHDSDIDCADWTAFANAWTGPGSPTAPAQCQLNVIPAISHWGLTIAALIIGVIGTMINSRRAESADQ